MGRHAARGPVVVAVHAHPDDETLWTGGLLATFAAAGAPVTLVTCTRGERGEVIGSALAHLEGDGPALASHRAGELTAALDALGVTDAIFLDEVELSPQGAPRQDAPASRYEDSGMVWVADGVAGSGTDVPPGAFVAVEVEEAAARLSALLVDRRADVVVTYEPGGGYGHPDHVRAHEVTMRAVDRLVAEGHAAPVVLWAATGEQATRTARAALRAETAPWRTSDPHLRPPADDRALPPSVVPDGTLDLGVDVAEVLDQVVAALRAHATQVQAIHVEDEPGPLLGRYALSDGVVQPLASVETYRVAPESAPLRSVAWPDGVFVRDGAGPAWVQGSDPR